MQNKPKTKTKKQTQTSTSLPWDLADESSQPPPQKRTKSSELYRRQHGISPERTIRELASLTQHPLTRERHRDRDRDNKEANDRERRDRSLELRESLLGQALEGGPTLIVPTQVRENILSEISLSTNNSTFCCRSTRTWRHCRRKAPAKTQTHQTMTHPTVTSR
jgi:hypothetical protein